jgi:catechol 2,3-dioxygenase-like lactoylglutathione lyase family enzyme
MHFQTVVMNVADLDRAIEFYRGVFGFTELSRKDRLAAIAAAADDRCQVIILRSLGTTGVTGGGRHTGMRALVFEVDSLEELERIDSALDQQGLLLGRRKGPNWSAIFGRDPDHTAIAAGTSLTAEPIGLESWAALDESLYGFGE